MYVPGNWKTWSGVLGDDVVPSSGNVQSHSVGLPPEVSRKSTVNGTVPLRDDGAKVPLPMNAAVGAAGWAATTSATSSRC